ncbi:MAG: alpha/beta hydrolase, partial [Acidobacteria bacterium]|nr:alpha/beta hydrolase [Acidobacteriota bacterium]
MAPPKKAATETNSRLSEKSGIGGRNQSSTLSRADLNLRYECNEETNSMILCSVRRDFTSDLTFNSSDEFREIQGGALEPSTPMSREEAMTRVAGKRCLVLVHGYRNEASAAAQAYDKVQQMLAASGLMGGARGYEEVIGFLWPGGFTRTLSFFVSILRANRAGKRFEKLLVDLEAAGATVDIQTHSLGGRVALEALDRERARVRWLLLTAPAVDNESIEVDEEYEEAVGRCQRVYVSGISILGLPDPDSIHQRLTPVPDLIRIPFPRAGQCLRMASFD